jgi:hypothetical protein
MSNINPQSIDGTYPIAGQDNNSQGFRDNFTNTVNNFTFAAAELTDLQQNAVLKAALGSVGQTGTPTNDLNYAYLTHAQLKGATWTRNDLGNVTAGSSFIVDWATGQIQRVGLDTTATMSFATSWPANNLWTHLRLQVNTYANAATITFPASITNVSTIQGYTSGTSVSLQAGSYYVFEFGTNNNGSAITIQDVLRNYNIESGGVTGTFTTVNATTLNIGSPLANVRTTGNVIGGLAQFASINSTPIGNATPSTGAFTTLSTSGAIVNTGVQLYVPTANTQTFTGNVDSNKIIIAPKPSLGASSYQLVTLPNVTTNGTTFSISANVTTYIGTFSPWVGTGVDSGANVAVAGGTSINFIYSLTENKWFKV